MIKEKFDLDEKPLCCEEEDAVENSLESLNEILNSLSIDSQLKELLINGRKKRTLTKHKIEFIKVASNNKYTLKEIRDFLNISQPAISKIIATYNIIQ